ncbi:MAG TPA: hypothetical protein ENK02_02740 [Planctomycetes bacterium]|nr:hypothetical protein [Planctomycetota bacterium]
MRGAGLRVGLGGLLLLCASCGGGTNEVPQAAKVLKPGLGIYELLPRDGAKEEKAIRLGDRVRGRVWLRPLVEGAEGGSEPRPRPSKIDRVPEAEGLRFQWTGPTRVLPGAGEGGTPLLLRPFEVRFLRTGELGLPALEIPPAKVAARSVQVRGLLPKDAKLQPILPDSLIRDPEGAFPWAWAGLAAALLVLGALWYLGRRRRSEREAPQPIPIPPGRRALIQLKELARSLEEGSISGERLVEVVTQVLRRYLDEAMGLHTREQTTEEILRELSLRPELGTEERTRLTQIVRQADLVKFARQGADLGLSRQLLEGARSFVLALEERRKNQEGVAGEVAYA